MHDSLPPFAQTALLLDLDGTLLEFAPTPDRVVVPDGLPQTLTRLCAELEGALAVITGRPAGQVDDLLPGIIPVVSGEHGGVLRPAPGADIIRRDLPSVPPHLVTAAEALAAAHPGVLVEYKVRGFVLHFRQAPEAGPVLHGALADLLRPVSHQFQVLASNMAWEVRPHGVDKGSAVEAIMGLPGFANRLPVFIGDDVTDEDGMAMARQMGGAGLFVPTVFGTPAAVRSWLARSRGDWAKIG
jgi:trehalose 6-phosphate phosphatase